MTAAGISDGKLFRDSFKGYNRQDVHKFIEKMSREHAENENALKIGCDRLLRQKSELERIIAGLKESYSVLEAENTALFKKAVEINEQAADMSRLEEIEGEVVRLREQLVQRDTELAQLRRKAAQPQVNTADIQSGLVIKLDGPDVANKFDESFKMIGSFLQLANDTAKSTVSEAKQKAEDIIREAYEEKESYIKERQDRLAELNKQYAELCLRSSGIIKELMQVHGALDGQLRFSGTLFGGDENGEV